MPNFFPAQSSLHSSKNGHTYYIHEVDESADPRYYGYADHMGSWIIMQQTIATGAHRYATGKSSFPTNWTGKAVLDYDYYYNLA